MSRGSLVRYIYAIYTLSLSLASFAYTNANCAYAPLCALSLVQLVQLHFVPHSLWIWVTVCLFLNSLLLFFVRVNLLHADACWLLFREIVHCSFIVWCCMQRCIENMPVLMLFHCGVLQVLQSHGPSTDQRRLCLVWKTTECRPSEYWRQLPYTSLNERDSRKSSYLNCAQKYARSNQCRRFYDSA